MIHAGGGAGQTRLSLGVVHSKIQVRVALYMAPPTFSWSAWPCVPASIPTSERLVAPPRLRRASRTAALYLGYRVWPVCLVVPVGLMRDESIAPSGPITREEERGRRDLLGLSQPLHCVVRDQRRDHGVGIRSIL